MTNIFAQLMILPMLMGRGRRYFEWQLAGGVVALIASAAWLVAPVAIWQAFGAPWMLLWLVPTTAVVFGIGLTRGLAGGG